MYATNVIYQCIPNVKLVFLIIQVLETPWLFYSILYAYTLPIYIYIFVCVCVQIDMLFKK